VKLNVLRIRAVVPCAALAACVAVAAPVPVAPAAEARATASKSTVLKKGSRGAAVRALQRRLGIAADGVFGPMTRRAVKRFQRRKGLVVDGIAGPATLAALGLRAVVRRQPAGARVPRALARIAACESGGNPAAISPGGRYRGKYQFSRATWRAMGGKGDPAKAPEAEQDRRAKRLYRLQGPRPWPACARKLGLR
jgi:peptidoglycan hydrolase-like protein with peptidoglycan-binding domain